LKLFADCLEKHLAERSYIKPYTSRRRINLNFSLLVVLNSVNKGLIQVKHQYFLLFTLAIWRLGQSKHLIFQITLRRSS
jgi:hypothetical protein